MSGTSGIHGPRVAHVLEPEGGPRLFSESCYARVDAVVDARNDGETADHSADVEVRPRKGRRRRDRCPTLRVFGRWQDGNALFRVFGWRPLSDEVQLKIESIVAICCLGEDPSILARFILFQWDTSQHRTAHRESNSEVAVIGKLEGCL